MTKKKKKILPSLEPRCLCHCGWLVSFVGTGEADFLLEHGDSKTTGDDDEEDDDDSEKLTVLLLPLMSPPIMLDKVFVLESDDILLTLWSKLEKWGDFFSEGLVLLIGEGRLSSSEPVNVSKSTSYSDPESQESEVFFFSCSREAFIAAWSWASSLASTRLCSCDKRRKINRYLLIIVFKIK